MDLYEYFQTLNDSDKRKLLTRLISEAQHKTILLEEVYDLIKIMFDKKYKAKYSYIIARIIFLAGPFKNNIFFSNLLSMYLSLELRLDKDLKLAMRQIVLKEISCADDAGLEEYKRILESKGVKSGLIADLMARRNKPLDGYVFNYRKMRGRTITREDPSVISKVLAGKLRKILP